MNNKFKYALLSALSFSSLQAIENITPNRGIQIDAFGAPIKITGRLYDNEGLAERLSDQYLDSPQSLAHSPTLSEMDYTSDEDDEISETSPINSPLIPRNIYPAQFETPEKPRKEITAPNAPDLHFRDDATPFSIQSDISPFSTGILHYSPDSAVSFTSPFQNIQINDESSFGSPISTESVGTLDRAFFEVSNTEYENFFEALSPVPISRSSTPVYLAMSEFFTTSPNQTIIMENSPVQEENLSSPNATIVLSTPKAPEKKRGRPAISEGDLQELKISRFI